MFRGDVHSAIKPADRPTVKADAIENLFVAQRGKELVLLYERLTIEDALTAVIECQVQPVAVKRAGGNDPFQFILYFHTLIQWVNLCQSLTILHTLPVIHQFVLVQIEPLKDKVQCTTRHFATPS